MSLSKEQLEGGLGEEYQTLQQAARQALGVEFDITRPLEERKDAHREYIRAFLGQLGEEARVGWQGRIGSPAIPLANLLCRLEDQRICFELGLKP